MGEKKREKEGGECVTSYSANLIIFCANLSQGEGGKGEGEKEKRCLQMRILDIASKGCLKMKRE